MARSITRAEVAWRWCKRNPIVTSLIATVALALLLGAAVASWQGLKAQRNETKARYLQYIANMNLLQYDWEQTNIGRMQLLLDETREHPERGFEWFYWQGQLHRDLRTLVGHSGPVKQIRFSPDGKLLATISLDCTANIWNTSDGTLLHTLQLERPKTVAQAIEFSHAGDLILTASGEDMARVWGTTTGKVLFSIQHRGGISGACFSHDNQRIVTGGTDGTVKVWDSETQELIFGFQAHEQEVWACTYSRDGKWIATAADAELAAKVWMRTMVG